MPQGPLVWTRATKHYALKIKLTRWQKLKIKKIKILQFLGATPLLLLNVY
jgi:hypothetical protein